MRLPIRLRLTAWYVALLALVLAGVATFAVTMLRSTLGQEIDRSLTSAAPQLARAYQAEGAKDFFDVANTVFPGMPAGPAAAQVVDARGRLIVAYGGGVAARPMLADGPLAAATRGRVLTTVQADGGDRFRVVAVPVTRKGRRQVVVTAKSLAARDDSISRLLGLLLLAFPGALVVTAAGGWLLARRALQPIERMTSRAEAIGVEDLAERIPVPASHDEVTQLAVTLNGMLERLQRGVEERRRVIGDASHELRTPLAAMQAELDVTLRYEEISDPAADVLASVREEVEHMSTLVANLLILAGIDEERLELRQDELDLHDLLERATARLEPLAARSEAELAVDAGRVTVVGDRERIREVVSNLVMNAIKFAGTGAHIRIATWEERGEQGFLVSDDGPGIPVEVQSRVFDRFWRAEGSRTRRRGGSGLGLAICREIVAAQGGSISLTSEEGGGACFRVSLPAALERAPA